EARGEAAGRYLWRRRLERSPFALPFRQAAIEQRDIVVAEQAQHPPRAPRRRQPVGVVDDDPVAVSDAAFGHFRGETLRRGDHMGQGGARLSDVVDVEIHRARYVPGIVVLARGRDDPRLLERRVEHPHGRGRVVEMRGEPLGADQRFGVSIGHRALSYSAKAILTRRFCRPLFSILVIATGPISAVLRTCVPPQGCKSTPAISISRTRPAPIGGLTDIVRTSSGRAASSSSAIQRGAASCPSAISLLMPAAIASL